MPAKKAASAPKAPAARPAPRPAPRPLSERPCPKGPDGAHLFLDQVEGDGRVRQAFYACRHCGGRVNTHKVEV